MKRAVAIPFLIILAGLYIIVGTPDVVTQTVEYEHSHEFGVLLVILGMAGALMAALVADLR